ncbi:MAG: hypothetical protein ACI3ZQ_08230 [Candidatus Cryptobacteroides sp.]
MKRKITEQLVAWKNRPDHKPLILQGARQVGKTYIIGKVDEFTLYPMDFEDL